jgi:hypothetical protein
MTAIVGEGQLQVGDYLAAQRVHRHKRGLKRALGFAFMIWYVALIVASAIATAGDSRWGITLSILVAVGLVYLVQRFLLLPRRSRRIFGQQRNLQVPFRIEFSDVGVAARSETTISNHPWDHYLKWKEDPEYFLLYHSDVMFLILPKRFLDGSRASDELRELMVRKLGHAA